MALLGLGERTLFQWGEPLLIMVHYGLLVGVEQHTQWRHLLIVLLGLDELPLFQWVTPLLGMVHYGLLVGVEHQGHLQ